MKQIKKWSTPFNGTLWDPEKGPAEMAACSTSWWWVAESAHLAIVEEILSIGDDYSPSFHRCCSMLFDHSCLSVARPLPMPGSKIVTVKGDAVVFLTCSKVSKWPFGLVLSATSIRPLDDMRGLQLSRTLQMTNCCVDILVDSMMIVIQVVGYTYH